MIEGFFRVLIFEDKDRQFEKQREKFEKRRELWTSLIVYWRNVLEFCKRMIKARKVHPEKTVGALYRPVYQVT